MSTAITIVTWTTTTTKYESKPRSWVPTTTVWPTKQPATESN